MVGAGPTGRGAPVAGLGAVVETGAAVGAGAVAETGAAAGAGAVAGAAGPAVAWKTRTVPAEKTGDADGSHTG